jgi:hypothetical protein
MPAAISEVRNPADVLACRTVLNQSLVSFFGTKNRRSVQDLIDWLLRNGVLLVRDLLFLGPNELWSRYPVTHADMDHLARTLAAARLTFDEPTSILVRVLAE